MQAKRRREAILDELRRAEGAVSAGTLAARHDVSRQIIVGDIALLRAAGENISATPRGYIINTAADGLVRQIACRHTDEQMETELNAIVDQGCAVLDVIVEHPVYGQLTGVLELRSRYDVGQFLRRCREAEAKPLSGLTDGIHLHTVSCPDEAAFERMRQSLRQLGLLLEQSRFTHEKL